QDLSAHEEVGVLLGAARNYPAGDAAQDTHRDNQAFKSRWRRSAIRSTPGSCWGCSAPRWRWVNGAALRGWRWHASDGARSPAWRKPSWPRSSAPGMPGTSMAREIEGHLSAVRQ